MDPGKYAMDYLNDVRYIEKTYGLNETYSFDYEYIEVEIYKVLMPETLSTLMFAIMTVILVVLFITVNLQVTVLVVFCVCLVDFFVLAFAHYWGLTMNNILAVNLSFALGIAVDYSTHIAHTYLLVEPPAHLTSVKAKREYKARKSISQMGSSVFHGGFSTFLAVSVLYFARLYTFVVFFRTWVFIIGFGMLNGMILLPILLSIVGPVSDHSEPTKEASKIV